MRLPMLLAVTAALALPTVAASQSRPSATELATKVDALIDEAFATGHVAALGVAVVLDGETIYLKNRGITDLDAPVPLGDDALWYLSSTSKSFTGFAAALMAERGELRFDDPIGELLPEAQWAEGVRPDSLTLADFLAHTTRLDIGGVVLSTAFTGALDEADLPRWLRLNTIVSPPGLRYSNLGYEVAGMIMNRRYPDGGWRGYQAREVFAPAGMHDTHTRVEGLDRRRLVMPHSLGPDGTLTHDPFHKTNRTMGAAGGHIATLGDLARWVILQSDSGRLDGRQVFPSSAVVRSQTMLAEQTRARSRTFGPFTRDGWGAGWDIGGYEGERMISRFGGYAGLRSHLSFLPGRRVGVVAQVSSDVGGRLIDMIAGYVYDLEAGRPDARARAEAHLQAVAERVAGLSADWASFDSLQAARAEGTLPLPVESFLGHYRSDGYGNFELRRTDDGFGFQWGDVSGPATIYNAEEGQWRIAMGGAGYVVRFVFGEDGIDGVEALGARLRRQD